MAEELKRLFSDDKADELISAIANTQKVDKQQGVANAGKALVVGSDGIVGLGNTGLSDASKVALLNCFSHVVWTDAYGQNYYDALERELNRDSSDNYGTPITSLESLRRYSYVDATGGITEGDSVAPSSYSLTDYFPISPSRRLTWIKGKAPLTAGNIEGEIVPVGNCSVYRMAYYDENKEFIRRDVSEYNLSVEYQDPDIWEFIPPENARYIRISWNGVPYPGAVLYEFPDSYYEVMIDLAKSNDADIVVTTDSSGNTTNDATPLLHITRNGIDITGQYITNNNPVFSYGVMNREAQDIRNPDVYIFDRTNRFINWASILLIKGDVISCSGKIHINARRILDGKIWYSQDWIVNGSFTVGVDGVVLEPVEEVEEG